MSTTTGASNIPGVKVRLQTSDNKVVIVDMHIIRCSLTIMSMLDDLGQSISDEETAQVELQNVNSEILKLIIQWAKDHMVISVNEYLYVKYKKDIYINKNSAFLFVLLKNAKIRGKVNNVDIEKELDEINTNFLCSIEPSKLLELLCVSSF